MCFTFVSHFHWHIGCLELFESIFSKGWNFRVFGVFRGENICRYAAVVITPASLRSVAVAIAPASLAYGSGGKSWVKSSGPWKNQRLSQQRTSLPGLSALRLSAFFISHFSPPQ